jgi:HD-GYP domain-containing protein (c-di-GMP phosphodiesterase class II)
MPLLVPSMELEPGMRLSEALVSDGTILLQGGKPLTRPDIEALQRRYPNMQIRVGDPVLDSVVDFEDDTREREVAADTQRRVADCMEEVHQRFADHAHLGGVQVGALQRTVRDLMGFLRDNPVSAALVSSCMDADLYLGAHAGNVFYLSMLIGFRELDYVITERKRQTKARSLRLLQAMDLMPLGLGTLLMDIGMVPLLPVLRRREPLTPEQRQQLLQHPTEGLKALPESLSALTRMVVRTHHEDLTGHGYPKGIPREKVHVFTRIARIADAFDAATSSAFYSDAKSPARTLWEMVAGPYRNCYDPRLLRALLGLIQPFPVGKRLELADGRHAVVVRYNRRNPFDPHVLVAFDQHLQRLPKEEMEGPLRLSERRDLRMSRVDDEDMSFLYNKPMPLLPATRDRMQTPLLAAYP